MLPWLQRTQNKTIPYARTKREKDHTYKNTSRLQMYSLDSMIYYDYIQCSEKGW